MGLEQLGRLATFVCREVVQDDDATGLKFRDQNFLYVGVEGSTVHRTRDYPRSDNPLAGQARNQGLIAPPSERGSPLETSALLAAPVHARHIRVCTGLVDKNQPLRPLAHDLLPPYPVTPRVSYLGFVALLGNQPFFYMCTRDGAAAHQCHL